MLLVIGWKRPACDAPCERSERLLTVAHLPLDDSGTDAAPTPFAKFEPTPSNSSFGLIAVIRSHGTVAICRTWQYRPWSTLADD